MSQYYQKDNIFSVLLLQMGSKRQRTELTLERKFEVICYAEQYPTQKKVNIAEHFNIKQQTLSDMLKNATKIKDRYMNEHVTGNTKRIKIIKFPLTAKALLQWFTAKRVDHSELPVSGEMLRQKGTDFARALGELKDEEEVDMNWISRWKTHHDISSKKMAGESATVSEESIRHWKEVVTKEIMAKYSPDDILNCDECGLFWMLTPDRTLAFKYEKVHGGKKPKMRITILNCVSMTGKKFPLLVIGKFKKPRCLKNIVQLPVTYRANQKAWMTSELFTEFVRSLDQQMQSKNRKVALILDRCPAHPKVAGLKNVELFFLPPNTTSKTQPLDAGIINVMKRNYRKRLVHRMLACYENEMEFTFNLLDAINTIKQAWDAVSEDTIVNCFRHVYFTMPSEPPAIVQVEREDFGNIFDRLRAFLPVPAEINFDNYVEVDNDLATAPGVSDSEILKALFQPDSGEVTDLEVDESEGLVIPSFKDATQALRTVHLFLQTHGGFSEDHLAAIESIQDDVTLEMNKASKQTRITDFFTRTPE
jgi:hypothetical protein